MCGTAEALFSPASAWHSALGQVAALERALAHGADVEAPDQEDGTRPLHHAAGKGDIRMLDVLLGGGPRDRAPERDATKTSKSTNICF